MGTPSRIAQEWGTVPSPRIPKALSTRMTPGPSMMTPPTVEAGPVVFGSSPPRMTVVRSSKNRVSIFSVHPK